MKEDFVSFELAVKLREKGFRNKCVAHYAKFADGNVLYFNVNDHKYRDSIFKSFNRYGLIGMIDAPTIAQVLKWLREEKGMHVRLEPYASKQTPNKVIWCWTVRYNSDGSTMAEAEALDIYHTYEEAALASITYILYQLI